MHVTAMLDEATDRFAREVWHNGLAAELGRQKKLRRFYVVFRDITLCVERLEWRGNGRFATIVSPHYMMKISRKFGEEARDFVIANDCDRLFPADGQSGQTPEQFKELVDCLCEEWSSFRQRFLN